MEVKKIVLCKHCLDDGFLAKVDGKEVSLCLECFRELTKGVLPVVTDSKPGCVSQTEDAGPWSQNAVRAMEGD